jgi:hypothetical protein
MALKVMSMMLTSVLEGASCQPAKFDPSNLHVQPSWGGVPRCCSSPAEAAPLGLCPIELARCNSLLLRSLALEAVTGPGSKDLRSLDWSGDALASTWVALLLRV